MTLRRSSASSLIIPARTVIRVRLIVETGIKAVFGKLESFLEQERGVGEICQILFGDALIFDRVIDNAAEECDIGACADLQEHIGSGSGARETRIDHDRLGVANALGLNRPLETARVVFSRIASHDQHHVGVLDVDPAIGHRTSSKRGPQTGDRGTVSNPGLIFYISQSQAAHRFDDQVIKLVGIGAAAVPGDALQAIDGAALRIG